ncbi:MAG: BBP7 family outer membrane beta-barrel protein [Planctomycetota bacterium]
MMFNRIPLGLASFLVVVSVGITACGQDLAGMALFEPADVRPYGNWAKPKDGLFFTFDGLYWHISPPAKTSVGEPGQGGAKGTLAWVGPTYEDQIPQINTIDTGTGSVWKWGDRMEIGYIEGHQGIMFTTLSTQSQTSETSAASACVFFNDSGLTSGYPYLRTVVPSPSADGTLVNFDRTLVKFDSIYVQNKSRLFGVEALYIYRPAQLHAGGTLEFTAGGRYFELKDQFWVDARGSNLTDSYWNTHSHNQIVGPEIGMRWFQPMGRFGISAEGRFTAGINSQSVNQDGLLGRELIAGNTTPPQPTLMVPTGLNHSDHWIEFSPIIELRVEAHMQLTNLIAVKVGYTGIFVNNVVRAADMVDYTLPTMGITRNLNGNLQDMYAQGLNISIEVNR